MPLRDLAKLTAVLLLFLAGCAAEKPRHTAQPATPTAAPPTSSAPSAERPQVRFREVGLQAGLDYHWTIAGSRPLNILQTLGNGCAFLDYDGDGNLDILLVGPQLA